MNTARLNTLRQRHAWLPLLLLALAHMAQAAALPATDSGARDSAEVARRYVAARHPWQNLESVITVDSLADGSPFLRCSQAAEAFLPAGQSVGRRTSVGVRCAGQPAWTLYVPVSVQAYAEVLVLRRTLPPRAALSRDDVEPARRDIAALGYGYLDALPAAGNWRLRQAVTAGSALTPLDLEPDALVHRGQSVMLVNENGGIRISQRGEALADAALGARVAVRNRDSGRQLDGVVKSADVVEVR